MHLQPLICVRDVEASSRWYPQLLGCQCGHGGFAYERPNHQGRLMLPLDTRRAGLHAIAACAIVAVLSACAVLPDAGDADDPASDAPAAHAAHAGFTRPFKDAPTYAAALTRWQGADDVNDWIGARFQYDMARALLLSESQRQRNARLAITAPAAFFDARQGVCRALQSRRCARWTRRWCRPA